MDILQELKQIAQERDIPVEELKTELELALAVAYQKYKGVTSEITVRLDPTKKSGAVVEKEIVGELLEPATQVSLDVARKYDPEAQIGDFMPFEIDTNTFGRIAAQSFRQVLNQKLREVELRKVLEEFQDQVGEVVTGQVVRREEGTVLLQVARTEVELPKREQVGTDDYRQNERMRLYVLKNLLRKLLEIEVPEIAEGIVEIKGVAREPGQRSKIAVVSHDERVDAVGACVGPRGVRVQTLMEELRPEKIDVVPFSEDAKTLIINALSPAKVNTIKKSGAPTSWCRIRSSRSPSAEAVRTYGWRLA
jgi:transcription termination/antitermination protein NusA